MSGFDSDKLGGRAGKKGHTRPLTEEEKKKHDRLVAEENKAEAEQNEKMKQKNSEYNILNSNADTAKMAAASKFTDAKETVKALVNEISLPAPDVTIVMGLYYALADSDGTLKGFSEQQKKELTQLVSDQISKFPKDVALNNGPLIELVKKSCNFEKKWHRWQGFSVTYLVSTRTRRNLMLTGWPMVWMETRQRSNGQMKKGIPMLTGSSRVRLQSNQAYA